MISMPSRLKRFSAFGALTASNQEQCYSLTCRETTTHTTPDVFHLNVCPMFTTGLPFKGNTTRAIMQALKSFFILLDFPFNLPLTSAQPGNAAPLPPKPKKKGKGNRRGDPALTYGRAEGSTCRGPKPDLHQCPFNLSGALPASAEASTQELSFPACRSLTFSFSYAPPEVPAMALDWRILRR